ncbi:MAG: phage terminase large subunit [Candidatus Omnitrophica bacterium]|nr:phage terminase large subunit [Candidatus Omnitrophota bacterium]
MKMDSKGHRDQVKAAYAKLARTRREVSRVFPVFRKIYFPIYHDIPDGIFQSELSTMLSDMTLKRGSRYAIASPRGCAKSTIANLEYVIYCICHGIEEFIVIISNTNDQAVGFLSDIKRELESNELLMRDFPEICELGRKPAPARWSQREIITRNNIKVLALGTGQQIRGRRNLEARPSLIIMDDIEPGDAVQNPESAYKLNDWVTKSVLKSGTTKTNILCVGTIHNYGSLLAQLTSPSAYPGWNKRIYRSVVSWSEAGNLWEQWIRIYNHQDAYGAEEGPAAARKFYEVNEAAMLQGAQVLWPASKSYYDLMVMRERDGYLSFDSEMQNEPVNPRDCPFNEKDRHDWTDRFASEEELLASLAGHVKIVGACDPSMGKQNKSSDYSAIITVACNTNSKAMYVLDADVERRLPDKIINDILVHHKRRNYSKFVFDSVQAQEFIASKLRERAQAEGAYLHVEDFKATRDKRARIEALQPMVKDGTIQFNKRHHMLLEQMKYFPKGHDDALDALEMACKTAVVPEIYWWFGDLPGSRSIPHGGTTYTYPADGTLIKYGDRPRY